MLDPKEIEILVNKLNMKFDKNGKKFRAAWKESINKLKEAGMILYPHTLKLVEIIFPLK